MLIDRERPICHLLWRARHFTSLPKQKALTDNSKHKTLDTENQLLFLIVFIKVCVAHVSVHWVLFDLFGNLGKWD